MPRTSVVRQASASAMQCPWYPADLLPQLQSTLAALADIELRYQCNQEPLQGGQAPRPSRRGSLPNLRSAIREAALAMFSG